VIVAFAGTVDGMTDAQLKAFAKCAADLPVVEFRCGCCRGADEQALELICRTTDAKLVAYRQPGGRRESPLALAVVAIAVPPAENRGDAIRSKAMVDSADLIIVAPKARNDERGGTFQAFKYARWCGKPIIIVWPDGTFERRKARTAPHARCHSRGGSR
jgi:hypothetical protein